MELRCPESTLETGSWLLFKAGAEGLVEEDGGLLRAFFPETGFDQVREKIDYLLESLGDDRQGLRIVAERPLEESDWMNSWREFHQPVTRGPLTIVPPWLLDSLQPDTIPVIIDPAYAFGTGGHETTRLCLDGLLRWFEEVGQGRVLDVGTGSGVLALSAIALDSGRRLSRVKAVDIDPLALEATRENAERNMWQTRIEISDSLLTEIRDRFDLVLANLTGPVLMDQAENLIKVVRPGGRMVLSGLLIPEQEQVVQAFSTGARLLRTNQDGEWAGIEMEVR